MDGAEPKLITPRARHPEPGVMRSAVMPKRQEKVLKNIKNTGVIILFGHK
jgi:hypothetical protein